MHSWAYVLERQLANADPNLQRALAGIRTGIDQQVALIDDVLDAPRAETRTLAVKPAVRAARCSTTRSHSPVSRSPTHGRSRSTRRCRTANRR